MNTNISCSICLSNNVNILNTYKTNCNHSFCKSCLINWLNNNKYSCPLCRALITQYKNDIITNNLIFIRNNSIENIRNISNNLNNDMLYQNMRLKVCLSFVFVISFFLSNFLFIFYSNNQYLINQYEDYINCTINNCQNDIQQICK